MSTFSVCTIPKWKPETNSRFWPEQRIDFTISWYSRGLAVSLFFSSRQRAGVGWGVYLNTTSISRFYCMFQKVTHYLLYHPYYHWGDIFYVAPIRTQHHASTCLESFCLVYRSVIRCVLVVCTIFRPSLFSCRSNGNCPRFGDRLSRFSIAQLYDNWWWGFIDRFWILSSRNGLQWHYKVCGSTVVRSGWGAWNTCDGVSWRDLLSWGWAWLK